MRDVPQDATTPTIGPSDPLAERPLWPEDLAAATPAGVGEAKRFRESVAAEPSHRIEDLDRREQSIAEQAAALSRREREQDLSEQRLAKQLRAHESKANAIQAELGGRLDRCEELIAALEREQAEVETERMQLRSRQAAIRETILEELAVERQKLESEREALQAEKTEFRKRVEIQERELSTAREGYRASWESEREALRSQLTSKLAEELAEERRNFEAERLRWNAEQQREQAALEEERSKHEELLARAQSDFETIRQEREREFQERRRALEAEIGLQVAELETRLAEQQLGWESTRTGTEAELLALQEKLEAERHAQDEAMAKARAEFEEFRDNQRRRFEQDAQARVSAFEEERAAWIAERDAAQEKLDADAAALEELQKTFEELCEEKQSGIDSQLSEQRAAAERELARQRDIFEKECASIRLALDEERAVMENRLHFQSDHLGRTRDGLEEARREVDLRVQQSCARAVQVAEVNRLRRRQLDRYRELLDEKEQSLERERRLLDEMHRQVESDRAEDGERRERERQTVLTGHDKENLAAKELRDELVARAKQLAERQSRLDTLRVEIESTHRENLELRVALDEAWARLTETSGPEVARRELQVSREVVSEYFQKKELAIDQRRDALMIETTAARKQLDQVDSRRKELTDWVAGSLASLHRREQDLHRWAGTLETRDARARGTTDRWRREKLEAEQIIRSLLEQLAEATNDAPRLMHDPTVAIDDGRRRAAG